MNEEMRNVLMEIREQVQRHLLHGIIPFWLELGIDRVYGGYLTCFDALGRLDESDTNKYIVTQTRMIWGMSVFSTLLPPGNTCREAARQGVDFLIRHFWDTGCGGWYWKTDRHGKLLDDGKVVYGQSFAIYALAQYTLSTGDPRGLDYAGRTFDLLQKYCADTARGGYYENLEPFRGRLPAAIFTIGTEDPLLDDSVVMATKWLMTGGKAVLKVYPGAPHGFIGFPAEMLKEAGEALVDTQTFIQECLGTS